MSYGRWLNKIFLCPHYHQLHHSIDPKHYNRNYGLLFSVWDAMFGTLTVPEPGQHFEFGLANGEHDEYQSLPRIFVTPVVKMWGRDPAQARHACRSALSSKGAVP
jgi:sterol desaturase/sphingolipid hydroxylase (fatty acid hydroxylase superfamily)